MGQQKFVRGSLLHGALGIGVGIVMMIGRQITQCYRSFSAIVDDVLWHMVQRGRFPPLNPACLGPNVDPVPSPTRSAHTDPLTEGFGILNAVPKNRRNWTRRMCRKFGAKGWGQYKYPVMNRKLRLDHKTGEYFRLGLLPMGTYQKIRDETLAIQERMKESFGFQPKPVGLTVLVSPGV
eukprot:maker-scaffold119_size336447-snap-gene-2.35 protein:Tk11790 transcript:maker-scaffold119_size336447-snap-gene-2.35-mRNA-1 annotation:"39s ribosomal protein mitochondrial precursor"